MVPYVELKIKDVSKHVNKVEFGYKEMETIETMSGG